MAADSLQTSAVIPAAPADVYDAWLDGEGHAAMTGADATGSPEVGAAFTAWGGYISGSNLDLAPHVRIVQAWRTTAFPAAHADSRLEVTLEPVQGGTRVSIHHSGLPEDQVANYLTGWDTHYFRPMRAYFADAG